MSDAEAKDNYAAKLLDDDCYDLLIDGSESVMAVDSETGKEVCGVIKDAIPSNVCNSAYANLRTAAGLTDNRGVASGMGASGETRYKRLRKDGTLSNTQVSSEPVQSGIVGYFDRSARNPYCRQTSWTAQQPEKWQKSLPFIQAVNECFKQYMPERYEAQRLICEETEDGWVIPNTVYTTVTVNMNWQTAVHKDVGDLDEGFGCMATLRAGSYDGCYLCFPEYRIAVDMRTRNVTLANVHLWHGNTPIKGVRGKYERLSTVLYYRKKMQNCGSQDEELQRARDFS